MNPNRPRAAIRRWARRSTLGLSLASMAVVMAGAPYSPARAQAQEAVLAINLPAQSLEASLIQLGRQSSLQFFYAPDTVAGLAAPAVQGHLSAEQALQRLLAGSPVHYARQGRNITLSRPLSGASELAPVTVLGGFDGVTEGTGSFTMAATATATGLDLSMRETPQTVSVITRQQIEDQHLVDVNDVVRATPGMNIIMNGMSGDDTRYHARGFAVENMMIDGVPIRFDGFSMPAGNMVMYDHVEVVRGAPGLTAGTGTPSAVISLVRKRPTRDLRLNATATAGSWQRYGATLDAGGPLNEAGTLRGRVAGSWQDKHSFVDEVHDRNRAIYAILEADVAERTTLAVGASYQKNHTQGLMSGLPADRDGTLLDYPRSTFYGAPWSYAERSGHNVFADLTHDLASGWQAKASVLATSSRGDTVSPAYWSGASYDRLYTVGEVSGTRYQQRETVANLLLTGPVEWLGRSHELAFGLDWRKRNTDGGAYADDPLVQPGWMSVLDPTYIQALAEPTGVTWISEPGIQAYESSAYAAGRFQLTENLSAVLGARLTWYRHQSATSQYRLRNEVTPYAGLVYDIGQAHSVYASYTRILQPQSAIDAGGNVLAPITGTNMEVGVKGEYWDGALNTSLALFEIRQTNRAMADENGPSPCPSTGAALCQRAAGEVKTQGVDVGVAGRLLPGWEISAGYTYVKSRYVSDTNASNVGRPFSPRVPRHQFKLFSTYRLPGDLQRWTVGGSLYAQSDMYNGTSVVIRQGGYFTAGLMVGYKINPNLSLRLNVENLFDRRYYESLGYVRSGYSSNNWYGAPRNVMLTLDYRL